MRVGINLLYLLPGIVGGTETYAAGLLQALAEIDKSNEYIVFLNRESENWSLPKNFTRVVCSLNAVSRSMRYTFEQFRLPFLLKKYKIDLLHSLGYVGPLFTPCPAILTVPDLNFFSDIHSMSFTRRLFLKFFSIHAAQKASAVITISEFSKKEICHKLRLDAEKVTVTLLGVHADAYPLKQEELDRVKKRYGILKPYLTAFGGGAVHKNIPRLLEAYESLKKDFSCNLVLIGHLPGNVRLQDLSEDIIITGYVPNEDISPLLAGAEAFVMPSLYEGFGLPVLEAQQAGVPVVCSNAASLPEVAGDGALFFDPYSIQDMKEKIFKLLKNPEFAKTLCEKGYANAEQFSWERTACQTLDLYHKLCSIKRGS